MLQEDLMITFSLLGYYYLHIVQLVLTTSNVCLAILIFIFGIGWQRLLPLWFVVL